MLKALELAGFKSFADKTRFDFPDGITVVVGPNGSGKSNIVDAMKWVLGSQSAKALRGKEMSDVIFKGSQTRGPSGSAEVTIVFDNPNGVLPVDTPEVRVTRRVYRSGEGEYLINNQAVRLKDVRDLIRGTGIGIDAYSLIEQGKVDKMLNAGAKDRRAIFEEAAGISRFKAKKVEAERRLARVQGNLTRLGDIVDEVGSRLKNLRSQASKAEKYRSATERMRELRTTLAWTDWTSLSSEIDDLDRRFSGANAERTKLETLRDQMTQQRQAADGQLQTIAEAASEIESQRSALTTAIATITGRRDSDRTSLIQARRDTADLLGRARVTRGQLAAAVAEVAVATAARGDAVSELESVRQRYESALGRQSVVSAEAESLRQRRDQINQKSLATTRRLADMQSKQIRSAARLSESVRALETLAARGRAAAGQVETAAADHRELEQRLNELDQKIRRIAKEVDIETAKVQQTRRTLDRRRSDVADLQVRRQGVFERRKVLAELEQRQEGLSGGVRVILAQLQKASAESPAAPLSRSAAKSAAKSKSGSAEKTESSLNSVTAGKPSAVTAGKPSAVAVGRRQFGSSSVIGLVADCFDVDVSVAPLIDAALGTYGQYIVVRGDSLQQQILKDELKINSRVGLIRIDELPPRRPGDRIRLDGLKGVIGRADRMVRSEADHQPVVRHLLSTTWLVDSIATAIGLRKLSGAGLRFVTSAGELLENDGSIVVGPATQAVGLVSRRSELVAAEKELSTYDYQIRQGGEELQRLVIQLEEQTAAAGRCETNHRDHVTRRAGLAAEVKHAASLVESRRGFAGEIESEIATTTRTRDDATREQSEQKQQIANLGRDVETLAASLAEVDETLSETTSVLTSVGQEVRDISVLVAKSEQTHAAAEARVQTVAMERGQRQSAADSMSTQIDAASVRSGDLKQRLVNAGDELATLMWQDEQTAESLRGLAMDAQSVRAQNRDVIRASEQAIKGASAASELAHKLGSQLESAQLRRETLATRFLEDYEIDLHGSEVPEDFQTPEDRDAIESEITNLRGQLQRTTSVNMEALAELEELQTRYDELHGQYQDLTAAKDSLQRIIGRINADSRRLFLDTLEAIRINFQQLYRKSFGGGHADLVLEDSEDPLEAGVEIVATPPGKPSFSNSLLSGGEKALTAVALLMSIFKYRPSPFCVLDEVDAPFDEANIGRFVTVLSEFLDHSKFVVVTHSKKTMTAATTLYGVTMQESGVSKRVSIRFEDVSDDGEISESAA